MTTRTIHQLRADLATFDAAQSPARQFARDLYNRTIAALDAARAPLLERLRERAYENEVHRDMLQDPPEELALVSLTTSRGPWPKRVGPDWRETLATLRDAGELLGSQPLKSQLPIETYHRIGALRDRRDGTR